jgi:hypothetical protein
VAGGQVGAGFLSSVKNEGGGAEQDIMDSSRAGRLAPSLSFTLGGSGVLEPSSSSSSDDEGEEGSKLSVEDGDDDEPDSKRRYNNLSLVSNHTVISNIYTSQFYFPASAISASPIVSLLDVFLVIQVAELLHVCRFGIPANLLKHPLCMYFVTLFLCSSVLRWNCDIFSHHLCTLH